MRGISADNSVFLIFKKSHFVNDGPRTATTHDRQAQRRVLRYLS
jgi:hypothetical protein